MAVSFGTRKALGRRYSTDPALLMELERLQKEYDLQPGREARALQAQGLAQQQSQYDQSRKDARAAGMMGTGANLLTTGMLVRGMTKGKDEPFFGKTVSNYADKLMGNTPAEATQEVAGFTYPNTSYSVDPAYADAMQMGIGSGAEQTGMTAAPASGFSVGPAVQAAGLYALSNTAGRLTEDQPWMPKEVSSFLKYPVAGPVSIASRTLGKASGVKELGNVADTLEKTEQKVVDFITNPIESISSVFGGW